MLASARGRTDRGGAGASPVASSEETELGGGVAQRAPFIVVCVFSLRQSPWRRLPSRRAQRPRASAITLNALMLRIGPSSVVLATLVRCKS